MSLRHAQSRNFPETTVISQKRMDTDMKKRMAPLIALLAVLLILFAAYFVMRGINQKNEAGTADSGDGEDTSVVLTDYQNADVKAITFKNPESDGALTFKSDGETWSLASDPNFPASQTKLTAMASALSSVTAEVQLESGSSDDYGLAEPAYTVTASYQAGEESVSRTFYIGDYNSFNDCYYFSEEGSENIYMIASSFAEVFDYTQKELVQTETKPSIDKESITSVDISAGTVSRTIEDAGEIEVISGLYDGLSTSRFLTWYADEEALRDAGLEEPAGTVTIRYSVETTVTDEDGSNSAATVTNEKQVTLTLGGLYTQEAETTGDGDTASKKYTCCRINDSDFIYLMDESAAQTLLAYAAPPAGEDSETAAE